MFSIMRTISIQEKCPDAVINKTTLSCNYSNWNETMCVCGIPVHPTYRKGDAYLGCPFAYRNYESIMDRNMFTGKMLDKR